MPTCRRKRVVLTEPSSALIQAAARSDAVREVFYLEQTGEIFDNYETYAARMSFYRLKQFQCEVTGKSNMDYFQALESELQEARTLHSRFPEPLKPVILKAVQWQIMGRLDHLVEAVYERYKDRYFEGEKVFVDVQGDKFYAKVVQVFPPKRSSLPKPIGVKSEGPSSSADSLSPLSEEEQPPIHNIGGDLKIPAKEAMAGDDPAKYFYKVQILEEERERNNEKSKSHAKDAGKAKWSGSLMEVQCSVMSRDRLAFSKSILRRFIRDCVDRDAAVASPWTVKPAIAERYGVASIMPEETRKGVENVKKGEIDKRKKVWEEKEGPPTKKQKKMTAAQEERAKTQALAAEKREREAREKAEKQAQAKAEAERLAAEKKKKKPVRYPTEDMDVRLPEKDRKAGAKVRRPIPSRNLPFNDNQGSFESFLMAWNFLVVYGQPLHLSTFTIDEFSYALRHSVVEPSCQLLAEVHSTLIYNLRTVSFKRHSAVVSLMDNEDDSTGDEDTVFGISNEQLLSAMADVGNNWERVPLRHAEGREGWEDALVGCLKDHANRENFPRLREILTRLLFAPESSAEPSTSSSSSRVSTPGQPVLSVPSTPSTRYHTLPPIDRVAILAFMCNLAVSSKAIHSHMESCEEQLTALRKEKIEVNRLKKQYIEGMSTLIGEAKEGEQTPNPQEQDTPMRESSDVSDVTSDVGSDGSLANGRKNARHKDLRQKAQLQAHAKQRELARQKASLAKQAMAEHRRLDEEVNKLERRLEGIEREFRKLLGAVRVKPLGKDRFHNRIWWFDGLGSASLLGSGGVVQYGTGRIFIQGPTPWDAELLERREEKDVDERRREEEGEEGMLGVGEWAVYTELEEIEELVAWLNPKGVRELALKNAFTKWWSHISPGVRKRLADVNVHLKLPEARRSTRNSISGNDISREPYMMWTNRRAINAS